MPSRPSAVQEAARLLFPLEKLSRAAQRQCVQQTNGTTRVDDTVTACPRALVTSVRDAAFSGLTDWRHTQQKRVICPAPSPAWSPNQTSCGERRLVLLLGMANSSPPGSARICQWKRGLIVDIVNWRNFVNWSLYSGHGLWARKGIISVEGKAIFTF